MTRSLLAAAFVTLLASRTLAQGVDTTPPANVTDLAITATTTSGSITLQWTAPGDDGATGTAAGYDLRYATSAINDTTWLTATQVENEPAPAAAGTVQTITITGLLQGYTYWFRLKTRDELNNTSGLSNSPSGSCPAFTSYFTAFDNADGWVLDSSTLNNAWAADASPGSMPGGAFRSPSRSLNYNNGTDYTNVASAPQDADSPLINVSGMTNPVLSFWCNYKTDTTGTATDQRWIRIGNYNFSTTHVNQQFAGTAAAPYTCAAMGTWHVHAVPLTASWGAVRVRFTFDPVNTNNNAFPGWFIDDFGVDESAPAAIANLAAASATNGSITLQWTAPGDDGNTGTAFQYDLRRSTSGPITTDALFNAATAVTAPAPAAPGTTQSVTISGLLNGTTYYFAIKTRDEIPRWSGLSNALTAATLDTIPPQLVQNLSVGSPTENSLRLTWNAPRDDGEGQNLSNPNGPASSYDIRYSTAGPINSAAAWDAATPVTGEPAPAAYNTQQTMTVSGLATGVTHWFAIKSADEVPNWSVLSNSPSGVPADVTPPAQSSVSPSPYDAHQIMVQWINRGDDGVTGTAALTDVRYTTAGPITTLAQFNAATPMPNLPAPAASGTWQWVMLGGLTPSTTYWFAVRQRDEAGNWSSLSSSPACTTKEGIAPAAVTNLTVTGVGSDTVTLQWTAPGDDGNTGTASWYAIKYSTAGPITTDAQFEAATYGATGAPGAAGTTMTATVWYLASDVQYWFAIRTQDEVPNVSGLSNSPSATMIDIIAPGAVNDLATTASTQTSITLQWTATGDNGTTGTATAYDLRYTVVGAGVSFDAMTPAAGEPAPAAPGTVQSFTVAGLVPGTRYWFVLKVGDGSNWSQDSNNPTGTTVPFVSYTTSFDSLDGWTLSAPQSGVGWAADGTPASVPGGAAHTGTSSLNYNNGSHYTTPGYTASSGTATSPRIQLAGNAKLRFWCNYSTEIPRPEFDQRRVQVSSDEFASMHLNLQLGVNVSCTAMGTWHEHVIDLNGAWGTVQIRFSFNTQDPYNNGYPGWFVDDLLVDQAPPVAIGDLVVTGVTPQGLTVQWTSPDDDPRHEAGAAYDLRVSTSPINTLADFLAATPANGEPAPASPGTSQSMTVSQLFASTVYYLAIRTIDASGNVSAISNTAWATTASSADSTPPAAIANVTITRVFDTALDLRWTAPGDDGVTGLATAFEVRISSSPITDFAAATPVANPPLPGAPGTTHTMRISGLQPSTAYYVAVRALDEAYNAGALSNVPSTTTSAGLTAQANGRDAVPMGVLSPVLAPQTVSGTLPSDLAHAYTIETTHGGNYVFSLCAADGGSAAFDSVLCLFFGNGSTLAASNDDYSGVASRLSYTLNANSTYYLAVTGNGTASGAYTLAYWAPPDATTPGAIQNWQVASTTTSSVSLQWLATGDNGSVGTAVEYDLRWATFPITDDMYGQATQVSDEPVPTEAGTIQSYTLGGLNAYTTYYFVLRARDESGNWSSFTNCVYETTIDQPDTAPPAAILTLTITAVTSSSLTIQWTATGDDGNIGTASAYDVRISTSPIYEQNFDDAVEVDGEPAPAVAGTVQSMTIPGLAPGTTYYVAIRADDGWNVSTISTVPNATTSP